MRIGIDGTCWRNNRGFGRFTRELLPEIFKAGADCDFVVFTDEIDAHVFSEYGIDTAVVSVNKRVIDAATVNSRRSVRDVLAFSKSASSQNLDLIFYPAVYSWFPPPRNTVSVVTFHDAIAEHYPELVFPQYVERLQWNAKTWLAKKSCDKILTVSNVAKKEIVSYLKILPEKISVICEGADAIFEPVASTSKLREIRSKYQIPLSDRYLIYVGGFAPHKNLMRLVNAFLSVLQTTKVKNLRLILVGDELGGGFHSDYQELKSFIDQNETLCSRTSFAGYVPDDDLAVLYAGATALVLPSVSEGFGLPALEAMSCRTPVLAADGGAVMEVAGEAGLSFDPLDVADIARAIDTLAGDPDLEAQLRQKTQIETERNTWSRAAALTLSALKEVYREKKCAS